MPSGSEDRFLYITLRVDQHVQTHTRYFTLFTISCKKTCMLLSTDKCAYKEQVIPHSNSTTTISYAAFLRTRYKQGKYQSQTN